MTWPVHLSCASFNRIYTLCIFAFVRTSVSGILSCHLIFRSFLRQLRWKWSSFLVWRWYTVQVSHAYERVGSTAALLTFSLEASLIPFRSQTFVRSLPKCYADLRSSGCNLIINMHFSGKSASDIADFINNLKFFVHSQ